MTNPFFRRRRPVGLYVLAGVAAIVALVAAGLVIETALTPKKPENLRIPPVAPVDGSAAPATSSPGSPAPPAPGALQVLQGRTQVAGMYTGFPHTLTGAVSAAVEDWSQIGSTLSPGRAATIGALIADPSWRGAPAALANGTAGTRQGLGLPASGPVPAGASAAFTAIEYQVRQVSADQATVLLLAYFTTQIPGQQPLTRVGVYPITMHWARKDWKVVAPGNGADYSGLLARPGSARAAADGWHPLEQ